MPRPRRQMHGRRALAAAAAAVLLISLFAPWYRESIVARGLTGLRTMTITRSGWDAFSFTEALVLVVAVAALVLVAAVPVSAASEGGERPRVSGAIVALLGAIACAVILIRLSTAPGTTKHALSDTMIALRWGIFLALGSSALLTVAGLRLIRTPRPGPARARGATSEDDPEGWPTRPTRPTRRSSRPATRANRTARTDRAARPERPPRAERTARSDRPPRPDGRGTSPTPAPRRSERPRPARHGDPPRWEDQSTGWLDLPE